MLTISDSSSVTIIGVILPSESGISEELVMMNKSGKMSPTTAEKHLVIPNSQVGKSGVSFVVTVEDSTAKKKYVNVEVSNAFVYDGHYTVLKLKFDCQDNNTVTLSLARSFLSYDETVPESDITMSFTSMFEGVDSLRAKYSRFYGTAREKLSLVYLVFDTALSDSNRYYNDRSEVINRVFLKNTKDMSNAFFSVMTFGSGTERIVPIQGRTISNSIEDIISVVSLTDQVANSRTKSNPFDLIFKLYESAKGLELCQLQLDITCAVIMVTDGSNFSDDILTGFSVKRDKLGVKIYCMGGTTGSDSRLNTIVNCRQWNEFIRETDLGDLDEEPETKPAPPDPEPTRIPQPAPKPVQPPHSAPQKPATSDQNKIPPAGDKKKPSIGLIVLLIGAALVVGIILMRSTRASAEVAEGEESISVLAQTDEQSAKKLTDVVMPSCDRN